MTLYASLPAGAQTAYSELFEQAQLAELRRSVASLDGSIQEKRIKARSYAYFAFRDALSGKVRQIYIGPKSETTERLGAELREARQRKKVSRGGTLTGQARAAVALGCTAVPPKHYRVLKQVADARFFRAGGVLVGSHAFVALGNVLGVRWSGATRTEDLDFAHAGPRQPVEVALPADIEIDVDSALKALDMGYLPTLTLEGQPSGTYESGARDLRIDFLTPQGRSGRPFEAPKLGVTLKPLRFLEYLLDEPVQAAVFSTNAGAIVVNVPGPERFALHKLLVAGERPDSERGKARKDVTQAAMLLECLLEQSPGTLGDAWQKLASKGKGWSRRVERSLARMKVRFPEVYERLVDEGVGHHKGRRA